MNLSRLHKEVRLKATRSSGSGGQHVNKVATKVELIFDIGASVVLTEDQKKLLFSRLKNRISGEGLIRLSSQANRSQLLNRKAVLRKFDQIIKQGLRPVKRRKTIKVRVANPEKRLRKKKRRSEIKSWRKKVE